MAPDEFRNFERGHQAVWQSAGCLVPCRDLVESLVKYASNRNKWCFSYVLSTLLRHRVEPDGNK
jgi:hypothetical protein